MDFLLKVVCSTSYYSSPRWEKALIKLASIKGCLFLPVCSVSIKISIFTYSYQLYITRIINKTNCVFQLKTLTLITEKTNKLGDIWNFDALPTSIHSHQETS